MSTNAPKNIDTNEVQQMSQGGMSGRKIAAELQVSPSTIYYHLKRANKNQIVFKPNDQVQHNGVATLGNLCECIYRRVLTEGDNIIVVCEKPCHIHAMDPTQSEQTTDGQDLKIE